MLGEQRPEGPHYFLTAMAGPQQLLRRRRNRFRFPHLYGARSIVMTLSLLHTPAALAGTSPYRLVNDQGQEITWANEFLDGQCLRLPQRLAKGISALRKCGRESQK